MPEKCGHDNLEAIGYIDSCNDCLEYVTNRLSSVKHRTCNFEELKEHVKELNDMLQNPDGHGTFVWIDVYAIHMKAISNYWIYN